MVERLSRRNRTRQEKLDLEAARGSLTLQEYADAFRLDRAFLRRLGLRTGTDPRNGRAFVEVPYKNAGGHVVAIRRRHALKGPRRFTWRPGDKPILYGRTYLRRFRECGFATLVEGESDCHVLWSHRFPALGLPGATTWKDEWATGLEGLRIFVVQEPDQGGETLVAKLARSPLADRLRVVRLEGAKDPAQLHVKDPDAFRERFKAALSAAVRLPTPDQVPPPTPDRARPEIARQRPSERIVIDRAAAHRAGEALAVVRAFVRHE
ncbi:MAG: hypothetical protein ACRD3V_07230 [Vicinamibacteria bacterium]